MSASEAGSHTDDDLLVNLSEIGEIELIVLKRLRELTMGDHRGQAHGTGFDFSGLREWQAGDRVASIDWAQSTLTNFNPMVVREFEQPSTVAVVVVANRSLSTRCGVGGVRIAAVIARATATIGLSAVFFQDLFGLITFDEGFQHVHAVRPRIGKSQVLHCLDAYQYDRGLQEVKHSGSLSMTMAGFMRKTSLIPVISDFLFDGAIETLGELAELNSSHDVFIVLADGTFAFELPAVSGGWIETFDVETGESRILSRKAFRHLADRVREWQHEIAGRARALGLDVVRLGTDAQQNDAALLEFVAERRLRKR